MPLHIIQRGNNRQACIFADEEWKKDEVHNADNERRKMRPIIFARIVQAIMLSSLVVAQPVFSTAPVSTQEEISHLLDQIAQSNCQFIRNAKTYSAEQALEHINKKYNHLKKRIRTTEQFITYAASRSSITGSEYLIRCGDVTTTSKQWLEEQLRVYRQNG
jgi:hypothetical protein